MLASPARVLLLYPATTLHYQIDADTRPAALAPPFTGHFRILVDTPRGLAPLHPGTSASSSTNTTSTLKKDLAQTTGGAAAAGKLSSESAASLAAAAAAAEGGEGGEPSIIIKPCSTCGTTTSATQYSSMSKTAEGKTITLCPPCYTEGRFPSTLHSGSFVKMSASPYAHASSNGEGGDDWTSQETLLLLEGLEMHQDDWDAIALHVGSRTKQQCIVKFLQLPIEEPFLEQSQRELGALQYERLPFSKEDNPVMGVMALLAETVGKELAAQVAGSSVEKLEEELRRQAGEAKQEEGVEVVEGEKKEGGEKVAEGANDDMDVDPSASASAVATNGAAPSSARQNVSQLALTALGSSAAKAHLLALSEDASLHSLVTSIVSAQVSKLTLKLSHFAQLETLLEAERRGVEQAKQGVYEDRLRVKELMNEVKEVLGRAKANPASVSIEDVQGLMQKGAGGGGVSRPVRVDQPGVAPGVDAGGFAQMG